MKARTKPLVLASLLVLLLVLGSAAYRGVPDGPIPIAATPPSIANRAIANRDARPPVPVAPSPAESAAISAPAEPAPASGSNAENRSAAGSSSGGSAAATDAIGPRPGDAHTGDDGGPQPVPLLEGEPTVPIDRSAPPMSAGGAPVSASGSVDTPIPTPKARAEWDALAHRIDTEILPIPQGPQPWPPASLGPNRWVEFRRPFPPLPAWNPPGPKRVGLQAGHWKFDEAPDELASLRTNPGASGAGKAEWQVNLGIAERAAVHLRAAGVEVDLLPTTIPVRYRAHAFVAIHADGDATGVISGYKLAPPVFSAGSSTDRALVDAIYGTYGPATGLRRDDEHISGRMLAYYAFNARRYQHAVAPGVPQAIIETGFMTNVRDVRFLIDQADVAGRGLAAGILEFLAQQDARRPQQ